MADTPAFRVNLMAYRTHPNGDPDEDLIDVTTYGDNLADVTNRAYNAIAAAYDEEGF